MLKCWHQNSHKRPSFKEISVFLNAQLQKLSKTISSISSFSSINSHNELKKLNYDVVSEFQKLNKYHQNSDHNDEADDEQTADVFINVNEEDDEKLMDDKQIDMYLSGGGETTTCSTKTITSAANQVDTIENVNENLRKINRSFGETSTHDSQYCSANGDDTSSLILDMEHYNSSNGSSAESNNSNKNIKRMQNLNDNSKNITMYDLVDDLNLHQCGVTCQNIGNNVNSNNNNNVILGRNNNDNENFTDSNYESASSYYSTTSPNHKQNFSTYVNSLECHDNDICVDQQEPNVDSPLISAKNLLVRMSCEKPFYANNSNNIKYHNEIVKNFMKIPPTLNLNKTPKILISPSTNENNVGQYDNDFVN